MYQITHKKARNSDFDILSLSKQDIKICIFLKPKTQKGNFIKKFSNLRKRKPLFWLSRSFKDDKTNTIFQVFQVFEV